MLNYEDNPVKTAGFDTQHAVAGIVIGCLVALILLRRGFRGVSVPGVGNVGLK
jgi:hypothetical protein